MAEAEDSFEGDSLQSIEEEMRLLESENIPISKKTQQCNVWAANSYRNWAMKNCLVPKTIENLKELSPKSLNSILKKFYYEVRTMDGKLLRPISLTGIRSAINRNLRFDPNPYQFDIIVDPAFESANQMVKYMTKKYLSSPEATKTKQRTPISDEDMKKIRKFTQEVMNNPNPRYLMYLAWFYLALYLGEKAREKWTDYLLGDLQFKKDSRGKYVFLCKTRLIDGLDSYEYVSIYEDDRIQHNAYNILKFFVNKIGTANKSIRLFNQPNPTFTSHSDLPWYRTKCPTGRNTIAKFMSEISKAAKLSKRYTNHCVKASTAIYLQSNEAPSNQVKQVLRYTDMKIIEG